MAKVKEFKCGYGVSFVKDDIWYKTYAEQTIEFEKDDDVVLYEKEVWDHVVKQVEDQIEEIIGGQ
jgi:hypothetical protein